MAHSRPLAQVTGARRGIGAAIALALAGGHFQFATDPVINLDGGLSLLRL